MCEHSGAAFPQLNMSRRGMLRATAAGALTLAMGHGMGGSAQAAESHIKSIHGSGFRNLNYFLANSWRTRCKRRRKMAWSSTSS